MLEGAGVITGFGGDGAAAGIPSTGRLGGDTVRLSTGLSGPTSEVDQPANALDAITDTAKPVGVVGSSSDIKTDGVPRGVLGELTTSGAFEADGATAADVAAAAGTASETGAAFSGDTAGAT